MALGNEPSIRIRRHHALGGVETWDLFDWMRGGCYSAPYLWFSAPVTPKIHGLTLRHEGRQAKCDGAGLLLGVPGDVFVVEGIDGDQPDPGERTLTNLLVPREVVDPDLWHAFERSMRAGLLQAPQPAHALRALDSALASADAPSLVLEEMLLDLLVAAVPQMEHVVRSERHACSRVVSRARQYIHAKWREPLSLADMSTEIGVTKWHLTRSFTQTLGMTPGTYARTLRGSRALASLGRGAKPMLVASEMGYSDQSHLTRELRRLYGITPAAYQVF
jgi:AraC-like DNA-binding protein